MQTTRNGWSGPVTNAEVYRRASGRRRHNAVRQLRATLRRHEVTRLWIEDGGELGVQSRIAQRLGVSRTTISRDLARIFEEAQEGARCPFCGTPGVRVGRVGEAGE